MTRAIKCQRPGKVLCGTMQFGLHLMESHWLKKQGKQWHFASDHKKSKQLFQAYFVLEFLQVKVSRICVNGAIKSEHSSKISRTLLERLYFSFIQVNGCFVVIHNAQ